MVNIYALKFKLSLNKYFNILSCLLFVSCADPQFIIGSMRGDDNHFKKLDQLSYFYGGIRNQEVEVGIYKCEFKNRFNVLRNCGNLDNLVFDNSNGSFVWNPGHDQFGKYEIIITTPSGVEHRDMLDVIKENHPPVLEILTIPSSFSENNSYSIVYKGTDLNADELDYTYRCLSNNCSQLISLHIDQDQNTLSFDTNYDSSGNYQIELIAMDGEVSTKENITFTVQDVNRRPDLTSIGDKSIAEGEVLSFSLIGVDADGDNLSYSCSSCPDGMTLEGANVSWTPRYDQSGVYSVTFTLSDDHASSLNVSETIDISVSNVNRAPSLSSISSQIVKEGLSISSIDANDNGNDFDTDGDLLTYSCQYDTLIDGIVTTGSNCTGLTNFDFNTSTGQIEWQTAMGSFGDYEFKIIASDGLLSSSQIFTIVVNESHPIILTFNVEDTDLTLRAPLNISTAGTNDYVVDWGDGKATTSHTGATTYNYEVAGQYQVKIYGSFIHLDVDTADHTKLISVESLGKTDLLSLEGAFSGCTNLFSFSVGDTDTSKVTSISSMFYQTQNLKIVDLTNLDTSSVTNMSWMFGFSKVEEIIFNGAGSKFDTSKVTSMVSMFNSASFLSLVDFTNFSTENVTDMNYMFYNTKAVTTLDLSMFDTAKVSNMSSMFDRSNASVVDASSFDTRNVTNMEYMFARMPLVTSINIINFNTAHGPNINSLFYQLSDDVITSGIICNRSLNNNFPVAVNCQSM